MLNLMGMCKYGEQVVWDYLSVNLYLCEWVVKKQKTAVINNGFFIFSKIIRDRDRVLRPS